MYFYVNHCCYFLVMFNRAQYLKPQIEMLPWLPKGLQT